MVTFTKMTWGEYLNEQSSISEFHHLAAMMRAYSGDFQRAARIERLTAFLTPATRWKPLETPRA